jgi:hypothetical protein
MSAEDTYRTLDDDLRRLSVYDVSAESAEETREQCLAAMARSARRRSGGPSWATTRRRATWAESLEPLAAVAVGALYLSAAVRASLVLLTLVPRP